MNIRIRLKGVKEVRDQLQAYGPKADRAMAATLTKLGKLGQAGVQASQPQRFTVRHAEWLRRNVKITPATKNKLIAEVVDTFAAMVLQEEGGTKYPFGRYVAVPLSGARPTRGALVKEEDRPHAVMASRLGFIRGNIMYRRNEKVVKSRTRKMAGPLGAKQAHKRYAVVPMYVLVPKAKVQSRYEMRQTVERIVNRNFELTFRTVWADYTKS